MLEELHTKPMQIDSRQNNRARERYHQRVVPVGADGVEQGGARGGREELGEDGGVEQEGEAQDSGADEERAPGEKTMLLVRVRCAGY